jgi:hypothetical protein
MTQALESASSIINFLIRQTELRTSQSWIEWRESVLIIYEQSLQAGMIDAAINSGKLPRNQLKSWEEIKSSVTAITENERIRVLELILLFRKILENSDYFVPEMFDNTAYEKICNLLASKKNELEQAAQQAASWYDLKKGNKFYTWLIVPASVRPVLIDFIIRVLFLTYFQTWGWKQLPDESAVFIYFLIQVVIIPTGVFYFAIKRDRGIVQQTESLLNKIHAEDVRLRIRNSAWHYLLLFVLVSLTSLILVSVGRLEMTGVALATVAVTYSIYLVILQTKFSKQAPSYQSIRQQIEDKEHMELSRNLSPEENDEEIVNLEVNLKAENERMNAYVIEAALFGALAFSAFLQLVAEANLSIEHISTFNQHLLKVFSHLIDNELKSLDTSVQYLTSKFGIFSFLSYQLLLCSIFFLAVIASRLRFSRLTDYVDRYVQLSKSINEKEETLVRQGNINDNALIHYNTRIKELLKKGYEKQEELNPIMEYMKFFRTIGISMFFLVIITGGMFISPWISVVLLFIALLSMIYFYFGKIRSRAKAIYIGLQEFYFGSSRIIHWSCWSMILIAIFFRTFNIPGGALLLTIGFSLLSLHYLLNIVVPVRYDYTIKTENDAFGSRLEYHQILDLIFKMALAIFFLGYLFKTMHWPAAGIMLVISLNMLCLYFLLAPKLRQGSSWLSYFLGLSLFVSLEAILFKFQHYPYSALLISLSIPLILISGLMAYLKRDKIRPMIIKTVIILFSLTCLSFIPFMRSGIINLSFDYDKYVRNELRWQVINSLYDEHEQFISTAAVGRDSMLFILNNFNAEFLYSDLSDDGLLNDLAWDAYNHSNDSILLANALLWSKTSVENDDNWMYIDTYAALLFKTGQYSEAKVQAEKAYLLGKDELTFKLIQNIDSALSPRR